MEIDEFEVEFNLMEEIFPTIAFNSLENEAINEHLGDNGVMFGLAVAVFYQFI